MSGRAGRRGLDSRGIVIMMCDEKLEPDAAKNMVKGQADRLDSAFHLGYNMIINLMRVEGVSPEYMLERCFYQFQNTMSVPVLEKGEIRPLILLGLEFCPGCRRLISSVELAKAEKARDAIKIADEEEIREYYELRELREEKQRDFQEVITHPTYARPFLQPGRMVEVKDGDRDFGWGLVVAQNPVVNPKVSETSHRVEERD